MGAEASIQTTITNINNRMSTNLVQNANASATVNCTVTIGSIEYGSTKNCTFEISNLCSASSSAAFDAVLDAVKSVMTDLSASQKQSAAKLLTASLQANTTETNINDVIETYMEQNCKTTSLVNNSITVENVRIEKCEATFPLVFKYINTGQATANCVMNMIAKVGSTAISEIAVSSTQSNDWSKVIQYVGIAIAVTVGFVFIAKILIEILKKIKPSGDELMKIKYFESNNKSWLNPYILFM